MKLTPLNIVLASVLFWLISEWNADHPMLISWGWLIAFAIIISLVDLGFRIVFKELKKIWLLQIGFILLVGIIMITLKLI